ncbi:histone-lysine N-methyltransferase SETMAR-like [Dermacentor albipictus]|uniref:histone-lysine N-methyltransferase SETMAR-like n=1 Tax=Dermacentor albipictus TaxID=60249 RepID=UPI0038FC84AB
MLKTAYKEHALSDRQVFRRHNAFLDGREEVDDEDRAGQPCTTTTDENVTLVRELLNSDRQLGVHLMANMLNMPKTQVHEIITKDIGMRKVCAKRVSKVLTVDEKSHRIEMCQEKLDMCKRDRKFLDVITGDETWVFEYDPETKRQSSEGHTHSSPRQKKARLSKRKIKIMLIGFFTSTDWFITSFLDPGTTVSPKTYVEVLKRLKHRVQRIRPDIADNWKLHHDNALAHSVFIITNYLVKAGVSTIPQHPYNAD